METIRKQAPFASDFSGLSSDRMGARPGSQSNPAAGVVGFTTRGSNQGRVFAQLGTPQPSISVDNLSPGPDLFKYGLYSRQRR